MSLVKFRDIPFGISGESVSEMSNGMGQLTMRLPASFHNVINIDSSCDDKPVREAH